MGGSCPFALLVWPTRPQVGGYIFKHLPKALCLNMFKAFVGVQNQREAVGVVPVKGAGALLV